MTDNRSPALAAFVAFVLTPAQYSSIVNKASLNLYTKTKSSVVHKRKTTNV